MTECLYSDLVDVHFSKGKNLLMFSYLFHIVIIIIIIIIIYLFMALKSRSEISEWDFT